LGRLMSLLTERVIVLLGNLLCGSIFAVMRARPATGRTLRPH
jgi:hypothetical protein